MLHQETVAASTLDLIRRLMADARLQEFYLVGGTALSLTIGHRISDDIDLFTSKSFDAAKLAVHLKVYKIENVQVAPNTVSGFIEDVKTDFIAHQYPLLKSIKTPEGIQMLDNEDIAAMKFNAIIQNGTRIKDFVDIYYLLERLPLRVLLDAYEKKYAVARVNRQMASQALLYDKDIDFSVPVNFIKDTGIKWPEIRQRLQQAIKNPDQPFVPRQPPQTPKQKSRKFNTGKRKKPKL